jgi:hypothetical protein
MAGKNLTFEDQVTLRMLKTQPKPHAQMKVRKAKASRTKRASGKQQKRG